MAGAYSPSFTYTGACVRNGFVTTSNSPADGVAVSVYPGGCVHLPGKAGAAQDPQVLCVCVRACLGMNIFRLANVLMRARLSKMRCTGAGVRGSKTATTGNDGWWLLCASFSAAPSRMAGQSRKKNLRERMVRCLLLFRQKTNSCIFSMLWTQRTRNFAATR